MLIRVIYPNGAYDMVKEQLLDLLLERSEIARFKRSDGWAIVGQDPVRRRGQQAELQYQGQERRGLREPV